MENIKETLPVQESLESNLAFIKQEVISMMQINPNNHGNIEDVNLLMKNMLERKLLKTEEIYELETVLDFVDNWLAEKKEIEGKLSKPQYFLRRKRENRLAELKNNLDIVSEKILEWTLGKVKNNDIKISGGKEEDWSDQKILELNNRLVALRPTMTAEASRDDLSKVLGKDEKGSNIVFNGQLNEIAFDLFLLGKITKQEFAKGFLSNQTDTFEKYVKLEKFLEAK